MAYAQTEERKTWMKQTKSMTHTIQHAKVVHRRYCEIFAEARSEYIEERARDREIAQM